MPEHIEIEQLLEQSSGLPNLRSWLRELGTDPSASIELNQLISEWVGAALGDGWEAVGMDIHPPNDVINSSQRWHFTPWLDGLRRAIQDHWRFHRLERVHPLAMLWRVDYYFNTTGPELVYGVHMALTGVGSLPLTGMILGKHGNTINFGIPGDDHIYYCTWSNIKYKEDGTYTLDALYIHRMEA